uniref:Uncharacterized protein n=1 Tax=viral metagenome TaxID=1070528 RepID=A0A6M3LJX5_9ZZZZ
MKAILEYNLPEDDDAFKAAVDGMKWALLVWDVDVEIRRVVKYSEGLPDGLADKLDGIRTLINDEMQECGLVFPS